MFSFFKKVNPAAETLYLQVQKGVRTPALYLNYGVEDTIEGRCEMLYLHSFMLLKRLKREDKALSQAFIEVLFSNMDAELREIGVGDTKVSKKIKDMGKSFYGRLNAYDNDDLPSAFTKNIPLKDAEGLAHYVNKANQKLETMTIKAILDDVNLFGDCHEQ
jgi:cytochrome b pre-mRNA-processing protein 3